jgi:dihydrolipoamide dehydrogenase
LHIAIIGGGPAGYVAAIRAVQLGIKVTLIEKQRLGGTCLHRGCVPTKALHQSAQTMRTLGRAAEFGATVKGYGIDFARIMERKSAVVNQMCEGIDQLVRGNGIEVIYGEAHFVAQLTLGIKSPGGEITRSFDRIIIATGSVPKKLPVKGGDLPGVYDSDGILNLACLPASLAIVGGGVIGMELACIFHALGVKISVIEALPRVLGEFDRDIVSRLAASLRREGISFSTDTFLREIRRTDCGLEVAGEGKAGEQLFEAEAVLIAAGRGINVEGLGLIEAGIVHDRNRILVDGRYETNVPGVYAVGDVSSNIMLAHVASEEGRACVELIAGHDARVDYDAVPAVVFTSPEIACVGLSEEQALARGLAPKSGRFPFGANAKAVAMGETYGMVKVVADADSKRIIGVHIIGPDAGTLIGEAALAVSGGLTLEEMAGTIHAHPTLPEALHEAALDALGRPIHQLGRRR